MRDSDAFQMGEDTIELPHILLALPAGQLAAPAFGQVRVRRFQETVDVGRLQTKSIRTGYLAHRGEASASIRRIFAIALQDGPTMADAAERALLDSFLDSLQRERTLISRWDILVGRVAMARYKVYRAVEGSLLCLALVFHRSWWWGI